MHWGSGHVLMRLAKGFVGGGVASCSVVTMFRGGSRTLVMLISTLDK